MDEQIRINPEKEKKNATNYLDKLIHDSVNDNNIIIKNKKKFSYENSYGKYIIKKNSTNYNNINFQDITIVLCLKNRPKRFKLYYTLNKSFFEKYNIKLIITEGKSNNMIDTSIIKDVNYITHYVVDIKDVWSRAVLLNYGVDKCKTGTVILSDIDFIYTHGFWNNILDLLNHTVLKKSFIGLALYETEKTIHDNNNNKVIRDKYEPYSACYIIDKNVFITVGGFDTKMIGFGWEERELQKRLLKNKVETIYTGLNYPYCYVLHYSHTGKLRGTPSLKNFDLLSKSETSKIEFKTTL